MLGEKIESQILKMLHIEGLIELICCSKENKAICLAKLKKRKCFIHKKINYECNCKFPSIFLVIFKMILIRKFVQFVRIQKFAQLIRNQNLYLNQYKQQLVFKTAYGGFQDLILYMKLHQPIIKYQVIKNTFECRGRQNFPNSV